MVYAARVYVAEKQRPMNRFRYSIAFMFLLFGVVQFNDPDPEYWASWYLSLTLLCVLDARDKLSRYVWLIPVLIGLVWLLRIWPEAWEGLGLGDGMKMKTDNVERARESGGLILSVLFSLFFFRFRGVRK